MLHVEKIIIGLKFFKLKKQKGKKKGKHHRTAKAQYRGRGLYQQ